MPTLIEDAQDLVVSQAYLRAQGEQPSSSDVAQSGQGQRPMPAESSSSGDGAQSNQIVREVGVVDHGRSI